MLRTQLKLAGAALVGLALNPVALAESVWFDAGIANYESWPSDGSDKVVEGAGVWRGTETAELIGAAGSRSLQVSTPEDKSLAFAIENAQAVSSDRISIRMSALFSSSDFGAELPQPDADVKCALTSAFVDEAGTAAYFGWVKDPGGETNRWVRLKGATPVEDEVIDFTFEFKTENGVSLVRHKVGETVLTDETDREWLPVVFTGGQADRVSSVICRGDGQLASLGGGTEKEIVRIALTIPEIDHVTVKSVTANGALVERTDGAWLVPQGAVVVVRFEAEDGYALTSSSMKFRAGDEAMELPAEGRPTAVGVSYDVVINEIMAKNGSTLRTATGFEGLDWVELSNRGDQDADLTGWYFGNDPTKKTSKWTRIEGSCVVPAHGYKILWCDGDGLCTAWGAGEAHVACNISTDANKHTLFLSPKADADAIVERITLPAQVKDVSFGLGRLEHNLLGTKDVARYRVGEGEWKQTNGSVGMSAEKSEDAGFTVTSYKLGRQLTSVDVTLAAIRDQAWKSGTQPIVETCVKTVAYRTSSQSVKFPTEAYAAFPTETGDLAMVVRGSIVIPESGLWTFSVGSDDGFRLTLANTTDSYSMEYAGTRSYGQTYSAFSMDAGAYDVELVYFDRSGGAAVDLSAAKGDYTTTESGGFSTEAFHLVGTAECPVLFGGALASSIVTDVKDEMLGKAQTLEWTATFGVAADDLPAAADTVRLKLRYADGIVARLNGTEIVRTEASARSANEALTPVTFAIDPALVKTENTLEITVTNDRIDDDELFLEAQVVLSKAEREFCYFREPTPGGENTTHGFGAMTPTVSFSETHGYKTEPFELTLSCADAPSAPIYYTLDGTSPTEQSTLYTGPIAVSKTTCVRAAVPRDNTILQVDCAATYLFLSDILEQSPDVVPAGFPADKAVNNHAMRYGLSAKGLKNDPARIRNAFTNSIATLSIVIDPKNLFDKKSGIYVNPSGDGRSWEREMMLEQINPNGDDGFSVPAGIRIRGAASRSTNHAKHSFRFFFRSEYGMGSLEYPLFGDEGADEFDKVDLRCSQNYSWANENNANETFIHECFSRDSQGAMGDYYTRSRYYNLFINGQYWGLYQTQERGDEDFAKTYNGGASANYDVIKTAMPGYNTGASEGTEDAWKALWSLIVEQPDGERNYRRAMGLNADGTRNPDYPVYLNPTNLVNYVLNFHFVCDSDAPISMSGFVNNLYAVRNRVDGDGKLDGFYFLRHDAEHSMGVRGQSNATADPTAYGTEGAGDSWLTYSNHFSPAELFWRLAKNDEFRMLVSDLYYKHLLKEGGALTAPVAKARFEKRMAEIDSAIVAEAARWSQDRSNPKTYANWQSACNGRLKFIDDRGANMLKQYRARGWYPSVDAARPVNALGGTVADGATFGADERLYLTGGAQGKVYYTTDGTDPRLEDGTVAPGAVEYAGGLPTPVDVPAFGKGAAWKYYDAGNRPATDWMAADYDDAAWKSGNGKLGFGKDAGTCATTLDRFVGGGTSGTQVRTFYFRKAFELPDTVPAITSLKVSLSCDDGYILYINGVEVKRDQVSSSDYDAFSTATNMGERDVELTVPAGLLKPGRNVAAVEVHQCNATSSDAWWDCALSYPVADPSAKGLAVPAEGLRITMRVRSAAGEWSALDAVSVKGEKATPKVEGDGFLFYLAGEFVAPAVIAPTGASCRVILDGATVPGLTFAGEGDFALVLSNESSVATLAADSAKVTVEGDGAVSFAGEGTLVSVLDLTVKSGTFAVRSTGVPESKTPVVNVLGSVKQTGGTIDLDLDVATDMQIYGIYVANKDMSAEFKGGKFKAKVGGTKSAAIYGNKGSVDPTFSGDINVTAELTGPQARFVNADGNVKLKGGKFEIAMPEDCASLTDARVFKATKDVKISGGTFSVVVPAAGSEIFSSDRIISVSGGVLSLESADDCFSATGDIEITDGIVHALSTAGDAIDSNGNVTISGGKVFAFTLSPDHDAIDVDPIRTESSSETHNLVIMDGATVVAVGGDQEYFHKPDAGTTATVYAENGLASSKKYVELTGVLAGDNAKTTTVLSVNWNKRHADTFTLIATLPGFDGKGYAETKDKPTDIYPNAYKLNDDIDGVFLRDTVEPLKPADWPEDPEKEITDETKPADLGITEGAFASAAPAELRKLAKWAKANGVAFGGAVVNAMAFDEAGNPLGATAEAYLLNCAPTDEAVAKAKAEFRFEAIVPGEVPTVEGDFNGTVNILGATTLENGGDWKKDNPDAAFFKAVLTFSGVSL